MVLDAEERERFVAQAFVGVVIQVQVRDFDFAGWQRLGVDAEAVILRSDFYLFAEQVLYGVIGAVMPEF